MGVVVLVKTLCHFDWQRCKDASCQALSFYWWYSRPFFGSKREVVEIRKGKVREGRKEGVCGLDGWCHLSSAHRRRLVAVDEFPIVISSWINLSPIIYFHSRGLQPRESRRSTEEVPNIPVPLPIGKRVVHGLWRSFWHLSFIFIAKLDTRFLIPGESKKKHDRLTCSIVVIFKNRSWNGNIY